ncbi:MAG: precorrin-8X methylmutase [Treponema sp.]|nr:precorrin-8X methylmutase [Treponema sp.]
MDKIDLPFEYSGVEHVLPGDIEKRSFEIIGEELKSKNIVLDKEYEPVIKRVIHTTADFEFASSLDFSSHVVHNTVEAIRDCKNRIVIISDTNMALSGISKPYCEKFSIEKFCFMADDDVACDAKSRGTTRAVACIDRASRIYNGDKSIKLIFAIGNAPTALIRIRELFDKALINPFLVIGVPVGFVNVVRSKELIKEISIPHIISTGRKGGSTVAAAICNALLYSAGGR